MKTGMLKDRHKGGIILGIEHFNFVDEKMEANNELSAQELQDLIKEQFGFDVSRRAIQRVRSKLGWIFKRLHYCQLISEKNCKKHLEFCLKMPMDSENFENVVFTNETKIKMESNIQR